MNWFLALIATIISYTAISYFALRAGGATTFKQALLLPVSNPIDFALILSGNAVFGVAAYFAFKNTPYAITIVISTGIIVSFVFSTLFTDVRITALHILGLALIILGAWFLK